jgi:ADP-heptose:LPS heptosyltransferase
MLNGKKVYISSCGGVGDLMMFTPALKKIKELYSSCHITFVTSGHNQDAIKGLPYIDKVIPLRRGERFGRVAAMKGLVGQDYAVFTDWQPQLLAAAFLLGVPVRAGIPKPGHGLNRLMTKMLKHNVMFSSDYAAETNAKIFSEALDINIEGDMTRPELANIPAAAQQGAVRLLTEAGITAGQPFICFTPFAGLEQRNWPVTHCRAFVDLIINDVQLPVVVLGPAGKEADAGEIGGCNLVGRTNLHEMAEIIRQARIHVGPDSGPMHIAGVVGTPTVALFSKDLPSRWAPRRNCRIVYLNLPCSPCDDATARKCETVACMKGITAEMVAAEVHDLLQETGGAK